MQVENLYMSTILMVLLSLNTSQVQRSYPSWHLSLIRQNPFSGRTLFGCCANDCLANSCSSFMTVGIFPRNLLYSFDFVPSNCGICNIDSGIRTDIIRDINNLAVLWQLVRRSDSAIIDIWTFNKIAPNSLQTFGVMDTPGQNELARATFLFKYLCAGHSGPYCSFGCVEDNVFFCDSQSGQRTCKNGLSGPLCTIESQPCEINPCINGGSCTIQGSLFRCVCLEGYIGTNCEMIKCNPEICIHGTCINDVICTCSNDYEGIGCTREVCNDNYCNTFGSCVSEGINVCKCDASRAYGNICQFVCTERCQNNGRCIETFGAPSCDCSGTGFHGLDCSIPDEINDKCNPNPCRNGGTCTGQGNDFTCECTEFWTGNTCENSACNLQNCLSGSCMLGGFCNCIVGYAGDNCNIISCDTYDLCQNNGNCLAVPIIQCECDNKRFTGEFCEIRCENPCKNGICTNINGKAECVCDQGFGGDLCQHPLPLSSCVNNPCQNGGNCIVSAGISAYTCICTNDYIGLNCERLSCTISQCYFGLCVPGLDCICANGFTGDECDQATCEFKQKICKERGYECIATGILAQCDCPITDAVRPECEHKCDPTCVNGECALIDGKPLCNCDSGFYGIRCNSTIEYPTAYIVFIALVVLSVIFLLGIIPIAYCMAILKRKDKEIAQMNEDFLHPEAAKRLVPDSTNKIDDAYTAFGNASALTLAPVREANIDEDAILETRSRRRRERSDRDGETHRSSRRRHGETHRSSSRRHGETHRSSSRRHGERSHRSHRHHGRETKAIEYDFNADDNKNISAEEHTMNDYKSENNENRHHRRHHREHRRRHGENGDEERTHRSHRSHRTEPSSRMMK